MRIMTTHALHLKQATAALIRMIMRTLLDFTRSAPGVWKLGQENYVVGTFFCSQDFVVLLWMQSVDFVSSLRLRKKQPVCTDAITW